MLTTSIIQVLQTSFPWPLWSCHPGCAGMRTTLPRAHPAATPTGSMSCRCWTRRLRGSIPRVALPMFRTSTFWVPEGTRCGMRIGPAGRLSTIAWGSGERVRRGLTSYTSRILWESGWPGWSRIIFWVRSRGLEVHNTRSSWYFDEEQALCLMYTGTTPFFLTGTMPYFSQALCLISHRHYAFLLQALCLMLVIILWIVLFLLSRNCEVKGCSPLWQWTVRWKLLTVRQW